MKNLKKDDSNNDDGDDYYGYDDENIGSRTDGINSGSVSFQAMLF